MSTTTLQYQHHRVEPRADETVLDALLRSGVAVPFSCKGGVCHTCMMQCTDGPIAPKAQKGLSEHLQRLHYFLPCICPATHSMALRAAQPDDRVTPCQLCEVTTTHGQVSALLFEVQGTLQYQTGQRLRIVTEQGPEPEITITSDPQLGVMVTADIAPGSAQHLPDWLTADAEFGLPFAVRGPYDDSASRDEELPYPAQDAALCQELGDGAVVRQVLEAFYAKVYADAQLLPFFKNVTIDRSIDKQYSFLKQCMTGEKCFMGDRPRNSHHWMVISHALYDHRQHLMVQTLQEHGLSAEQIARWTRFEEYFRPDIVKSTYRPRQVGVAVIDNDGFGKEVLSEATVCDHCGQAIAAQTEVLYHRRLGTVSCAQCAGQG